MANKCCGSHTLVLLTVLICASAKLAAAQGVVRDGVEYVYAVSPSACILYARAKMDSFIAQGKSAGKATSQRLLDDDGWELRFTDGSGVIRWYATKERCEHFRTLLNAVK